MARNDHLYSLLAFVAVGLATLVLIYLKTSVPGRLMADALIAWGLLSLPVGFLVGHYCALGDDPAR